MKQLKTMYLKNQKIKLFNLLTFLGQQCFGYQGYGHFRSECPTYLRLKGKIMVVSLNDDEGANHKSIVVDKNVIVDENPSDGKLSENADLQEA